MIITSDVSSQTRGERVPVGELQENYFGVSESGGGETTEGWQNKLVFGVSNPLSLLLQHIPLTVGIIHYPGNYFYTNSNCNAVYSFPH